MFYPVHRVIKLSKNFSNSVFGILCMYGSGMKKVYVELITA